MVLPAVSTGGQKAPAGSLPEPTFPVTKKAEEKQEWQVVSRARWKPQAEGSQSLKAPKCKETNRLIPKSEIPASYAGKLHQ